MNDSRNYSAPRVTRTPQDSLFLESDKEHHERNKQ